MRILIKFGSATITLNKRLNHEFLKDKIKEIAQLQKQGNEIVIVSSGAVAAGIETLNLKDRPKETLELQALSGIGQISLINTFKELFKEQNINVAQVLLTHHNLSTAEEKKNLKDVVGIYLKNKTIPIINENDVVSKEELMGNSIAKFTDNDLLAALVSIELKADTMILITDVEGLCDVDPKENKCAHVITSVTKITPDIEKMATKETNKLGRGGMASKVKAANLVMEKGISCIVGSGKYSINDLLEGKVQRTIFRK
ncbi:MAG: glutamate 5-kinase [Nanoarchaeota archaeon]|nr:glutamate 5-kinase [Nanoarchaeota archaeon]MBU1703847.1 glutamate 5-kinase [Nanoarchaeota archaeon]